MGCPFCAPRPDRIAFGDDLVRVLWDLYPVTTDHMLVVPGRHIPGWGEASADERAAIMSAVEHARAFVQARDSSVDGFNIGWNDGVAAGQTVMHLHVHVIPRRRGDVEDPRGGIRWVIPAKARYWTE